MMQRLFFQTEYKKLPFMLCIGISLLFFILSFTGILKHECWLDEIHHWVLARESHSFSQLLFNMRLEGHPVLWNLCLMLISKFTEDLFYMQLFHILLSAAAGFILLRHAPFTLILKIALLLSYFIFYEFNIVSRNYATGVLLAWILCSLLSAPKKQFLLLAFLAGMLAQVHLFFLFISLAVFIISLRLNRYEKNNQNNMGMVFIYLPLLAFAIYCIIPSGGHFLTTHNQQALLSPERLGRPLTLMAKAFLHIPDMSVENCWNSNYFFRQYKMTMIFPSILYWFIPFLVFYKRPHSMFLFYFSSLLIAVFLYASPLATGTRYYGVVFIALVMAGWLYPMVIGKPVEKISGFPVLSKVVNYLISTFLLLLLFTQVISGVMMYRMDFLHPFSQASATTAYVKQAGMASDHIAVSNIAAVSSMTGYLGYPVYSIEGHQYMPYSSWDIRKFEFKEADLLTEIKKCGHMKPGRWLLISNHPFVFSSPQDGRCFSFRDKEISINLIKNFNGSMISTENYFIYVFSAAVAR